MRCFRYVLFLLLMAVLPAQAAQNRDADSQQESGSKISGQFSQSVPLNPAPARLASGQGTYMPGKRPGGASDFEAASAPLYLPGNAQSYTNRAFAGMPAWAQKETRSAVETYPPFGANLFQGRFLSTYSDGVSADYVIMPGDRILVYVWGAYSYNDVLMVDQQGNVFLPEIGPVKVGGMRNSSLPGKMRQFLSSAFKANVEIYVNLLSSQPMAVYVTGFVNRPGRYAGGMADSVLYYLDLAGGIIAERGSFRDISIRRNGKIIAKADLYSFILNGDLPGGALRNGDVIVVGEKGESVIADGLIPQHAVYESKGARFTGAELMRFASPLPAASHVSVTGSRNTEPFHIYCTLKEFRSFTLSAGDKVEFLADRPGENILVAVSGATTGPTRYPVKRETSLRTLLAHIPVDPHLSNLDGIYIKRKSVAEQQRKALQDSLRRMENSVLSASSATQEGAAIRVQEAQLLQSFALRVAELEPNGVVVVTRNGACSDVLLEDGDEVVIPQRSDVVQISGEVVIPKAVVYAGAVDVATYVQEAGGFTDRANEKNILVVRPNGEVVSAETTRVMPGDMLLVMPEYDSKTFTVFKDIMQILYQAAVSAGVLLAL